MNCRACNGTLRLVLDLGETPLANSFAPTEAEAKALKRYPLRLCVCASCEFVQLDVAIPGEVLFKDYAYETPRTGSLTKHYAKLLEEISRTMPRPLRIVEMGSNNGAFLEAAFQRLWGPEVVLGIEPSQIAASVPTRRDFFTKDNAHTFGKCDLFVARHCMAHLDDLRGTLEGVHSVLNDEGWAVIENAYFLDTVNGVQFDQLYHEHHSYFTLRPMKALFESVGLHLRHVYHADIHGGSIAMFVSKRPGPESAVLERMLAEEEYDIDTFAFNARVTIAGLREAMRCFNGVVDSYGATAKGSTLLNVLGTPKLRYAVDSTPTKQGKYLPGVGVKVISEVEAAKDRPDAYLLTAWNYAEEIMEKTPESKFIIPFPCPRLV